MAVQNSKSEFTVSKSRIRQVTAKSRDKVALESLEEEWHWQVRKLNRSQFLRECESFFWVFFCLYDLTSPKKEVLCLKQKVKRHTEQSRNEMFLPVSLRNREECTWNRTHLHSESVELGGMALKSTHWIQMAWLKHCILQRRFAWSCNPIHFVTEWGSKPRRLRRRRALRLECPAPADSTLKTQNWSKKCKITYTHKHT